MRYVFPICLLTLGSLIAADQPKRAPVKAEVASAEQTLIQLERDWNQALLHKDNKAIDKIMAEDWTGIDFRGMTITRAESMAELQKGESGNQSVVLGEMKVRVFGDTAVVIGSDTEKSTYHGKDSSGQYAWTDVFVKRGGRWLAVASQSTKIEKR